MLKNRWNIVVVVALVLAAVSRSSKARADEERSDEGRSAKRRWLSPFASEAQPDPGRLSAAMHGGSVHTQGLGLGVTAFPWLEGKLSYGRNSGHSAVQHTGALRQGVEGRSRSDDDGQRTYTRHAPRARAAARRRR